MNVLYDTITRRILLTENDGVWTMPSHWELAHYEEGFEPAFTEVDGELYLKPCATIFRNSSEESE